VLLCLVACEEKSCLLERPPLKHFHVYLCKGPTTKCQKESGEEKRTNSSLRNTRVRGRARERRDSAARSDVTSHCSIHPLFSPERSARRWPQQAPY
jgi:hypothetical protein